MSYADTVARLLEMAPVGMTNDQLLWRLRRGGLRLTSQDIVEALGRLAESGAVQVKTGGKWHLTQLTIGNKPPALEKSNSRNQDTPNWLTAVAGHLYPIYASDAGSASRWIQMLRQPMPTGEDF